MNRADHLTPEQVTYGPPRERTLPEMMLMVLDAAEEDRAELADQLGGYAMTAGDNLRAFAGMDVYAAVRELLMAEPLRPPHRGHVWTRDQGTWLCSCGHSVRLPNG